MGESSLCQARYGTPRVLAKPRPEAPEPLEGQQLCLRYTSRFRHEARGLGMVLLANEHEVRSVK